MKTWKKAHRNAASANVASFVRTTCIIWVTTCLKDLAELEINLSFKEIRNMTEINSRIP